MAKAKAVVGEELSVTFALKGASYDQAHAVLEEYGLLRQTDGTAKGKVGEDLADLDEPGIALTLMDEIETVLGGGTVKSFDPKLGSS